MMLKYEKCNGSWNRIDKPPRLDLDGGYKGIRYPICVNLTGALYCLLGNTTLPDILKDYDQCWDDPTIQNFMLDDS